MKLRRLHQKAVMAAIAATITLAPVLTGAAEVTFPVPAYTQEELSKVREWEKTWVGKKIDITNIDQVAQFMPESYVKIFKDPQKWGAPPEGLYFYIVPYKQIIETKGMIEATRKYAPLVKTDADGKILNYAKIAGFPFPNPKSGLEIAYNMDCNTRGDSYVMRWRGNTVDPSRRSDRKSNQHFTEMYFIHRTDVDPKPVIPKNPDGYHKGQFLEFFLPPEMNNSRMIAMKLIDESKEYTNYLYYGEFRRIRRLSAAERTNAIDGTDLIYDDGNMWDGYISRNTYTYKGKKELLLARRLDIKKTTRQTGQSMSNAYEFERCNTYVVEVVSKDPHYIYSKRIWYLDPETYMIHWQEIYDKIGRFWKCCIQPTNNFKTAGGEMKNFMSIYIIMDTQRFHSGETKIDVKGIGMELSPKIFRLSNLQRSY